MERATEREREGVRLHVGGLTRQLNEVTDMTTTLIIPGHGGSGAGHWQTWLESKLPATARATVPSASEQDLSAWAAALRWGIEQLGEDLWIVAHGFGCLAAVQAAADYSERVAGALLVAPYDPAHLQLSHLLPETPLSFPSILVASSNDPHMRLDKAAFWAAFWNSDFVSIGAAGGIDPEAGFGPWPQGLEIFERLKSSPVAHTFPHGGAPVSRNALAV
jgi:predicted alpha/beta hydrolase family esterase